MTEAEYIIATNRVKVSMAIHAMRDTLSGDGYGIEDAERTDVLNKLYSLEERLFGLVKTTAA